MKGQNEQIAKQIVTRFAPSPTGLLHLGNYRTAVFCYLFARQNKGKFIVRIEDTDKERSKKEYEDNIIESLKWLGLDYDELHRQSERLESHKKYLKKLIDTGNAYVSKELAKDPSKVRAGPPARAGGNGMVEVVRFKNPNKKLSFQDMIRGLITFDTTELGDFVIARRVDEPLFHLAVVVDDYEMGVSHVVRGEDHISNTPRHILIQQAIGAPTPSYAHLPLVLADDRSKLSKRKGALPLTDYRDLGYLPEAVLNAMALIGWNPGTDQEILSKDELIKLFDLSKVQKAGAILNPVKLGWINKEYIKKMPILDQFAHIKSALKDAGLRAPDKIIKKVAPIILERINKWSDVGDQVRAGEIDYFFRRPIYVKKELVWKSLREKEDGHALTKQYLEKIINILNNLSEDQFKYEKIKESIWPFALEKKGEVLWPMRFALSGRDKSPDPFVLAETFGQTETIDRLKQAIVLLS